MLRHALRAARLRALWAAPFNILVADSQPRPDPRLRDLFDATGIAFIHVPKAAGSSVSEALYSHSIKHRTWAETRAIDPDAYDGRWLKFAIIREPVDRFLSAYDYLARGGRNAYDREFSRRCVRNRSVERFVADMQDERFHARASQWFHFQPQSDYVLSADGRIMVDRLIPFERIGEDLPAMIGREIPRLNVTTGLRSRPADLAARTVDCIRALYPTDAALHRLSLVADDKLFGHVIGSGSDGTV